MNYDTHYHQHVWVFSFATFKMNENHWPWNKRWLEIDWKSIIKWLHVQRQSNHHSFTSTITISKIKQKSVIPFETWKNVICKFRSWRNRINLNIIIIKHFHHLQYQTALNPIRGWFVNFSLKPKETFEEIIMIALFRFIWWWSSSSLSSLSLLMITIMAQFD